jgi:hypothetical protein
VPDRIFDDIGDRCVVLVRVLDHLRPVAPAEEVVDAPVPRVEGPRIASVEVAHSLVEVRLPGLDDEVEVVPHEAADVEAPAIAPRDAIKQLNEEVAVVVVAGDRHLIVAAGDDVVDGAGLERSVGAAHPATVASVAA